MILDGSAGSVLSLEPGVAFWSFEPDAGLVSSFLSEQGDLSAVERFAQFHEDADEPLQGRYYSALMPAHAPGPGQQLAFEVDLDRCSGCKACVAACHNLNGLDEGESWRDVGLVIGGRPERPVLQHVTSACHHCLDPACLNACPVDAYEKDPHTGLVFDFLACRGTSMRGRVYASRASRGMFIGRGGMPLDRVHGPRTTDDLEVIER